MRAWLQQRTSALALCALLGTGDAMAPVYERADAAAAAARGALLEQSAAGATAATAGAVAAANGGAVELAADALALALTALRDDAPAGAAIEELRSRHDTTQVGRRRWRSRLVP